MPNAELALSTAGQFGLITPTVPLAHKPFLVLLAHKPFPPEITAFGVCQSLFQCQRVHFGKVLPSIVSAIKA